ncbi:MAG: four helix bundle protein [Chloroflexi bacterium]|nr:four helix bundle protein [Chloroflexota bacterium]MCZ7578710.1 four helix bundle protein [Dehalococcoidia bacterium]
MDEKTFIKRATGIGLEVIRLADELPRTRSADIIARQLIRSATSVGANYRASCRARSVNEVIAKLGIVEEEADETLYWLDLLAASGIASPGRLAALRQETDEVLAMTVASKRTLKSRASIGNRKSEIGN